MPSSFTMVAKHMAGGTNLAAGDFNLKKEENKEAKHMSYTPEGDAITDGGYADMGIDWGENGSAIDGMYVMSNYPDLLWVAVNGKIKYADISVEPESSATVYEADPSISLTAGNAVMFRDYRGTLYYTNGVNNMGRIAVGRLAENITGATTDFDLEAGDTSRFTDGVDKLYIQGDEIDYTGWTGDNIEGVTNVATTHADATYVTQANTVTAPPSGSLKARAIAIFRDTMFIIPVDEPNVLRYGKTVSSVSTFSNIHDFSDGNNYLIGSAGELTALLDSGQDRLYIFTKDKTYYIGIEVTSGAVETFSPDRLFTGNYGCPNPFCVAEMEGVVVVFTGKRLIRFGYEPTINTILPDEKFDEEVFPVLSAASIYSQANARVAYSPRSKKLLITINNAGVLRTAVYDNRLDKYSYSFDFDPSCYAVNDGALYFGSRDTDIVYKFGEDLDADGTALEHALVTGRYDGGNNQRKFYGRGVVIGKIARGTTISFSIKINGTTVGEVRQITDDVADLTAGEEEVGSDTIGMTTVGGGAGTTDVYEFTFPFSVGRRGEDISFEWSSLGEGAAWAISSWQVSGITYDDLPYTHY